MSARPFLSRFPQGRKLLLPRQRRRVLPRDARSGADRPKFLRWERGLPFRTQVSAAKTRYRRRSPQAAAGNRLRRPSRLRRQACSFRGSLPRRGSFPPEVSRSQRLAIGGSSPQRARARPNLTRRSLSRGHSRPIETFRTAGSCVCRRLRAGLFLF